jgi:hypothetical protein
MMPRLTVGLIAGELRNRAERSLEHLLRQTALDQIEIVVIDVRPQKGDFAGADHPRVRYFHRPDLSYYCEMQVELVMQARAPLVAFIEDHSYAVPGWAAAILKTFEHPRVSAVNYTFTNAVGDSYRSRSILMAEYGHWMLPHPGGPVQICSSTNLAYRRDLLLNSLHQRGSVFEAEFLIHRAIQASNGEIHVAPEATVAHESWQTVWDACLANGANKRVLGARRAEHGKWGMITRVIWAGGMVLAPPLFIARLGWALRNRPALWGKFLASLPVLVAIFSYCAWSEALGYLRGANTSREEFRARELETHRDAS